jgi:HEPN domain-containing protein
MVCFVAQQSAEKALKAYLYAQGEDRVTGHSVERLSAWCAQYDAEFAGVRERVSLLDGYYIPTRYPNGLPDSIPARVYARDVAKDALRRAEIVLECVRDRLRSAPDTR